MRSVVALNPWVYPDDGVPLPGRRVLVVHGTADRIAGIGRAERVVERLRRGGTDIDLVRIEGGKHAMLQHGREFDGRAARFTAETLLGAR